MSQVSAAFSRRKALIAYLTVGYPSPQALLELVPAFEGWGCDLVELGIPFSDPLADGATIQEASDHALKQGVNVSLCLKLAGELRSRVKLPLVFMSYYNPIFRFGLEAFCRASAEAGIDGLIVPDLPPEEGQELGGIAQSHQLDLIYLLAPTSSPPRIDLVARRSRGFIYLVSLTGVTGPRKALPPELEGFVLRVRERARLPLAVGFGIASPEQARRVAQVADGIIVGSRLIQLIKEDSGFTALQSFLKALRQALG